MKILSLLLVIWSLITNEIGYQEAFASKLKKHYQAVQTLHADFKQEKVSALFDQPLVSEGKFYFQKADKIRWEQHLPSKTYFVINGNEVIQFDGKTVKRSTGVDMQLSIFRDFILKTVDGTILDDPDFQKSFQPKNGKMIITLIPLDRRMSKRLQRIELVFDAQSLLLDQLKMQESSDEYTQITFSDQQLNGTFSSTIFER